MKKIIEEYLKTWENKVYFDGIPDEVPSRIAQLNKAPSYKKICIAILNNDHNLKSLGFEPIKSKYYHLLKRMEIDAREFEGKQHKLRL